jgi:glucose-1-phosphate thymidylyltransferase
MKHKRKGIILAGGVGTRLYPATLSISKQLLPVYDKPMIYYPLSTLMLADIKDILIISTQEDIPRFKKLLGDGSALGLKFSYQIQSKPTGIPEAFIIGEDFIADDSVALILGDNIFYGNLLQQELITASKNINESTIFTYLVKDPERYGVAEFNRNKIISIEEKPKHPKSNYAVTGLYFYSNDVVDYAKKLIPSSRGETEITDLNTKYINLCKLNAVKLGRGHAWLDTGTHESLNEASHFISAIENRQGLKIACIEEISLYKGFIDLEIFEKNANRVKNSSYGEYLIQVAERYKNKNE